MSDSRNAKAVTGYSSPATAFALDDDIVRIMGRLPRRGGGVIASQALQNDASL